MEDTVKCQGKGCQKTILRLDYMDWFRRDAYGIPTGVYCDSCYEDDSKYPYKRDRYFNPMDAGEALEPEDY